MPASSLLPGFCLVHELEIAPHARVYEHGWQSFSPSTSYGVHERPFRPTRERNRVLNYRLSSHPGNDGFFSEGVIAVEDGHGSTHVIAALEPWSTGVRLSARVDGSRLLISADGPTEVSSYPVPSQEDGTDALQASLHEWAVAAAADMHGVAAAPAPTAWCSWYQYYAEASEADIVENLLTMDDLDLDVHVLQVDDGYEAEIGDWLMPSDRFPDLPGLIGRIRDRGRRAGIWIAPFLVAATSQLAERHPEWLVRDPHGGVVHAGHNWGQDLFSLDLTHPQAAEWMRTVLETFKAWGVDYVKADFLAAGAVPGLRHSEEDPVTAYRTGLGMVRSTLGPDVHLLGCGAPVLPSVGLVDSLRVSPDTDALIEPEDGDMSSPSQRAAMLTAKGRQFMNRVLFTNDPDCLIVRPGVQRREAWARHIADVGGAVVSSDRLSALDDWGRSTTRRLLEDAIDWHGVHPPSA